MQSIGCDPPFDSPSELQVGSGKSGDAQPLRICLCFCWGQAVDKWLCSLESHFIYQLEWFLVAAVPSLPPCLLFCKLGSNPMTCQLPYFFLGWMGAWGPWGTDSGDHGPFLESAGTMSSLSVAKGDGAGGGAGLAQALVPARAAQHQWIPGSFLTLDLLFSGSSLSSSSSTSPPPLPPH